MRASLLKSALNGASEIEEASSEIEDASSEIEETSAFSKAGLLRNHGPISDIEEAPVFFSASSASITCTLSFAKIMDNLLKRRSQISKRRQSFSASSAPITCTLSFAKITDNLSKRRSQISKRRQSFSASSAPVTCTLSFAEITGNLSKISDEEESAWSHTDQSLNGCQHE
ncbi:hypothetical protein EV2_020158 [Malus domestica]